MRRHLTTSALMHSSMRATKTQGAISLAWLGLWGKTPEKSPEATIAVFEQTSQVAASAPPAPVEVAASMSVQVPDEATYGYIPEPPSIVDESVILNALGEPTLQSLGLGSYFTPPGWCQIAIDYLHTSCGLEWAASILVFGGVLRLCMLPITIKSQRNAARMRKVMPMMSVIQERLSDAKAAGNNMEYYRRTDELQQLMKMHKIGPLTMLTGGLQMIFMIPAFMGIRSMTKLPIESMTTGGIAWFPDLTIADPIYMLPIIASSTILLIVYRGVDTGMQASSMSTTTKAIMYSMSLISFPFFVFMPSGVTLYMCATNMVSLALAYLISFDRVKTFFKIPIMSQFELAEMNKTSKKSKNFIAELQATYRNNKLMSEIKEREELIAKEFQRAGKGVKVRTFKEPPKPKKL